MAKKSVATDRRQARVRRALKVVGNGRPRLSVFRSSKQIYAQIMQYHLSIIISPLSIISSLCVTCQFQKNRIHSHLKH